MKYIPIFLFALASSSLFSQTRPNIIFIMADDHAAQSLSCYGSRINQTPNLDRIARNGILFENAFCTNSICSPVRAVNLTGKMSHINGVIDNLFPFDGSQPTAPKYLQAAGYQTAMIGKWHLKSAPTGFDYWKILIDQGEYYNPKFIDNGKLVQSTGYVTTLVTDDAVNWLQQRDPNKPFFMMLHHKAPHRNWMPDIAYLNLYDSISIPEPFTLFDDYNSRSDAARQQQMSIEHYMDLQYDLKVWQDTSRGTEPWMAAWMEHRFETMTPEQSTAIQDAYRDENEAFIKNRPQGKELVSWKYQRFIKDYLRCVASVDDNVGRLLDYLKASGLDSNTLVIYTSDQGFFLGEHGWFDKRFMYEESYRQPLLIQWPGQIPAGSKSDALVLNLDYAPTFLDLAGLPIPSDMQGVSMKPILTTITTPPDWRQTTYYHYFEYPAIHAVKRHNGVRTQRYKLIHFYYDIDAWELYDLDEDPNELRNVYNEPAYLQVRADLHHQLDSLQLVYGDYPDNYLKALEPGHAVHIALGAPVVLSFPSEKPGDALQLTDGVYQNYNMYNAGMRSSYLAFRAHPMEAVIDLGYPHHTRNISVHFVQSPERWIWFPEELSVYTSKNGNKYRKTGMMRLVAETQQGPSHQWYSFVNHHHRARYVKIMASGMEHIPDAFPGAGQKAWIFCDEVQVE